ncbi:DUF3455 domain-containing protein [Paraburkholderia sp. BL21I4N1]|uniref:DUF3455 domain-containing protein n=1 Tax=Paraburkholderia sp. BL21I4N1 TaxID=1938801 RepID=UPI000CFA835C|nr:DUF3455 domain-containing protein [Paraburkholderia sp. BL21I4N1]PQV54059.1 uncharacterized protein DUF3455 [Paraburkholderia sp. BL21I4N1]
MFQHFLKPSLATAMLSVLAACAIQPSAPVSLSASSSITPPHGTREMTLAASGVQNYSCEFDSQHRLGWVFKSPQAILFDTSGHAVVHHGAGPSWEAEDGSKIEGHVLAQQPSETPASIPQLLLETHGTGASGTLAEVRYVQRLHTVGGLAPQAPCSTEHQVGSSPYLADYVFYR